MPDTAMSDYLDHIAPDTRPPAGQRFDAVAAIVEADPLGLALGDQQVVLAGPADFLDLHIPDRGADDRRAA